MIFDTCLLENAHIKLIDGDRGKNYPKQSDFSSKGHCLFLSAKNVTKAGFDFSSCSYIGEERHQLLKAGTLEAEDIVMTTRGTIGNVGYFDASIKYPVIRINSGMMIFRANKDYWNPRFLYYVLTSPMIQEQILNLTSGSAVPQLPARDLKKFELPQVPLETQNKIEQIISSLSDKIVLNEKQHQTLEQIAQAIFKSWFVDFAPVKAKINALEAGGSDEDALLAAMQAISGKDKAQLTQLQTENPEHYNQLRTTAELFPSAMQESELGEIPEGWNYGLLSDISELNKSSWTKRTLPSEVEYVDLANTKNGIIENTSRYAANEAPSRARRKLSKGDTIIGTVRPGNRSYAFIYDDSNMLTGSTGFAVLTPENRHFAEFLYIKATSEQSIDYLAHLADGGAYPAVRPEVVSSVPSILPSDALVRRFHHTVSPYFKSIGENNKESSLLTKVKLALLPKLLSGEILMAHANESQEVD